MTRTASGVATAILVSRQAVPSRNESSLQGTYAPGIDQQSHLKISSKLSVLELSECGKRYNVPATPKGAESEDADLRKASNGSVLLYSSLS